MFLSLSSHSLATHSFHGARVTASQRPGHRKVWAAMLCNDKPQAYSSVPPHFSWPLALRGAPSPWKDLVGEGLTFQKSYEKTRKTVFWLEKWSKRRFSLSFRLSGGERRTSRTRPNLSFMWPGAPVGAGRREEQPSLSKLRIVLQPPAGLFSQLPALNWLLPGNHIKERRPGWEM